jgi:outer membrane protein OmpA-like peptidoglycan-associated protein
MTRRITPLILCVGIAVLGSACATKKFVREQVGTAETRVSERVTTQGTQLTGRIDTQETKLRETADRTAANSQAIETTGQKVQGLDSRVGEVASLANDAKGLADNAKKEAESVGNKLRETETEMNQRLANRNKFAELGTKSIFFNFNKADLQDNGMSELDEIANALKSDPNAVVELKGFADPRGPDRYNYQLTRERVDAVVRYLVQRHGIDLRRIHAVGMGKVVRAAGERATKDANAKSRRVDIRLLAPQS